MHGTKAGWEEATDVDGVSRIFGYLPSALPPEDFFLSVGGTKVKKLAVIDGVTWRATLLILAGLVASFCVAWTGQNFVHRPTQRAAFGPP